MLINDVLQEGGTRFVLHSPQNSLWDNLPGSKVSNVLE